MAESTLRDSLVSAFLAEMKTSDPETIRRHYAESAANVALRVLFEQEAAWRYTNPFFACGADRLISDLSACRTFEEALRR